MSSSGPMQSTAGPAGQSTVAGAPGDGSEGAHPEGGVARGTTIDRYVVLDRVGEGGMGVVYAAYDPDLDRKVAIKVLHRVGHSEATREVARTRMLREAQSLAKLSHPNVVTIHDVGTYAERAWIAMEFVGGRTLTRWLAGETRPWTAILEALLAVGDGVAAAHAAGVLHRDLKPDNVMVADDHVDDRGLGRVRVMDFGLARGQDTETDLDSSGALTSGAVLRVDVTRAGSVIGTPAYMAPEQLAGAPATTASDQFSYCVTMWEALFGARPFAAATIHEQLAVILDHAPRRGPQRVPTWLRRIVERGLAVEPGARHASVAALLDATRRGRRRARTRALGLAASGLVAAGAIALAASQWRDRSAIAGCERASDEIGAQWPGRRAEVLAAIERSDRGFAGATAAALPPWLDAFTTRWRATALGVCVAAEVDRTLDGPTRRRADACLDVHAVALAALLDSLDERTPVAVGGAIRAAANLPDPTPCGDPRVLARPPWSDAIDDRRVAEIRAMLARAEVVATFGASTAVVALDDEIHAAATALGWAPLVAEAELSRGRHLDDLSRLPDAEAALTAAYFGALRVGGDRIAAAAATALVRTVGFRAGRYDEGLAWAEHARAMLERVGTPSALDTAALDAAVAAIGRERGELEQARTLVEGALATREAVLGEDHPEVADTLEDLGNTLALAGDHAAAGVVHRRALGIRERVFGGSHPIVAASLNNLANVAADLDRDDEAVQLLRRAIEIGEAAYGADDIAVAPMLVNLANLHVAGGRAEQARALYVKALAAETRALGPDHKEVAVSHANFGGALLELRDLDGAVEQFSRAIAIAEPRLGPDHALTAMAQFNLGMARHALGEYEPALVASRAAAAATDPLREVIGIRARLQVATILRHMGQLDAASRALDEAVAAHALREAPVVSFASDAMFERGELALARGEVEVAAARLQEALDLVEEPGGVPEHRIHFARALAQLLRSGPRDAAVRDARAAIAELERGGAAAAELTRARSRLDDALRRPMRGD